MKPMPLHLLVSRINRLPLPQAVETLQGLIKHEKPYSVRRNELQSLLQGKMTKLIRRQTSPHHRVSA